MNLYDTANRIVAERLGAVRRVRRSVQLKEPPDRRKAPTSAQLWTRYCHAMLTSQQPITSALWEGLRADPAWWNLISDARIRAPRVSSIAAVLARHKIRFADQKAQRLRMGWDRPLDQAAEFAQAILANYHDKRRPASELREVEKHVARRLVETWSSCGVGHKIARLIMLWAPTKMALGNYGQEFHSVIPIDSRWLSTLRKYDIDIDPASLASESSYLQIEDELCRAAIEHRVRPSDLDQVVFGEGARE